MTIDVIDLDPKTAYISVSCYLEPGGTLGDEIHVDDIVVSYLP